MRILILGGDGYLGWPTAMHLSAEGHEVAVVDNYLRRRMCIEQNVQSLFQVPNLVKRTQFWAEKSGKEIVSFIGDLTDWSFVEHVFTEFVPDAIVHYAEQPSAPYSMLSREASMLTIENNLKVTSNLIFAIRDFCPDAHIVKLGTMGEYGTPNIDIDEGWVEIEKNGRRDKFLFPRQGSSLYHTTKVMDTDLLWLYVRMWKIRVTDLMQGPVYGLVTNENEGDPLLMPFFDYDELFGTVVNRFVVQAAVGYPLTVFGKGGQTRGYLNIKDTLNCVRLALENPAQPGELKIYNQITETFSVNDLASRVKRVGDSAGLDVTIKNIENPRIEAEEHYYNPTYTGLKGLGLEPNYLSDEVLEEMLNIVLKYKEDIQCDQIFRKVTWA